jgi:hypothetical protein
MNCRNIECINTKRRPLSSRTLFVGAILVQNIINHHVTRRLSTRYSIALFEKRHSITKLYRDHHQLLRLLIVGVT